MIKKQKNETITWNTVTGNASVSVVCNWHGDLVLVWQALINKKTY